MTEYADIDKVLSELRHGHSCLLLNENSAGGMTGFVVVAAEHCEAEHIAFMARQARGLVCLAMTPQRCEELELPLMVEGDDSLSPFTLSIEAATGIDTGISAADRARTVRVAVDASSQASDLVQPGHIFPIAAAVGGVLTRTAPAEAAMDLTTLAGLFHLPLPLVHQLNPHQNNLSFLRKLDLIYLKSQHLSYAFLVDF